MTFLTIAVVGTIATGFLLGFNWALERLGLVRGSMTQAVGSFVIPEPARHWLISEGLQVLGGIAFTSVYAYIFAFVHPATADAFMRLGGLIGLVHGFFVSYFVLMGFSAFARGDRVKPFTFTSALYNIVGHVIFGTLVGLGCAFHVLNHALAWFALYAAAFGGAGLGLFLLLVPSRRRLPRMHHATVRVR